MVLIFSSFSQLLMRRDSEQRGLLLHSTWRLGRRLIFLGHKSRGGDGIRERNETVEHRLAFNIPLSNGCAVRFYRETEWGLTETIVMKHDIRESSTSS